MLTIHKTSYEWISPLQKSWLPYYKMAAVKKIVLRFLLDIKNFKGE